jgi:hypothetical protein
MGERTFRVALAFERRREICELRLFNSKESSLFYSNKIHGPRSYAQRRVQSPLIRLKNLSNRSLNDVPPARVFSL